MEDIQYITELLNLALYCSKVKPRKMSRTLCLSDPFLFDPKDPRLEDEYFVKRILGYCFGCSRSRLHIKTGHKAKSSWTLPHMDHIKQLIDGTGNLTEYYDVFSYLANDPRVAKKMGEYKEIGPDLDQLTPEEKERFLALQKKLNTDAKKESNYAQWLKSTYEERVRIKRSLTTKTMAEICKKEREKLKLSVETLSVKSNTSIYAVQSLDEGKYESKYLAAKLLYYMLIGKDIEKSRYHDKPVELFVDYLAGWQFRKTKTMPDTNHQILITNPKACNLPLYLKK